MYGKITLVGRLGRDPEMRYTQTGTPVTSLNVAVDQGYGERKKTLWVDVTCWGGKDGKGGMAEAAATYLKKGSVVFVEGEPGVRAYMSDRDDEPKGVLTVTARELKFLDTGKSNGNGNGNGRSSSNGNGQREPAAVGAGAPVTDEFGPPPSDDDIPF